MDLGGGLGYAAICPGREINILNLKISNKPGSLHQVLQVIAGYGLNIVHMSTLRYQCQPQDFVDISLFIDFTGSQVTLEKLEKELVALERVVEVNGIRQQLDGFSVNTAAFPLEMMGCRAMILCAPIYRGLISGVRERLGSAGEALLYHLGIEAGKGLGNDIVRMGLADKLPTALGLIEVIHGRAALEFVEYKPEEGRFVVRARRLFECEGAGRWSQPYSSFYRGFLAGIATSSMGGEFSVVEKKCIAVGDSYCEFHLERRAGEKSNVFVGSVGRA